MNEEETTEQEQGKFAEFLKQSLTPMSHELDRDLWPKMRQRLDHGARQHNWLALLFSPASLSLVPWFDWALLAVVIVGMSLFPRSIAVWLYHF
jgi:hypothetical protein